MSRPLLAGALLAPLLLLAEREASSQTFPSASREGPAQYPPALPRRPGPSPPPMRFAVVREVPVPGPIAAGRLRLEGDGVHVPLREGEAVVPLDPADPPRLVDGRPAAEAGESDGWVPGGSGRLRFRTLPAGTVEAQRRCRGCRSGWKTAWRIRVGSATPSPPLVVGPRVCYGALDNQVYCVRASNGHRLWASEVGDRVSRALALWTGAFDARREGDGTGRSAGPATIEFLLVVPDAGDALVALDAYDGRQAAAHELSESRGRLIGPAVVTEDGRIVVARQGYQDSEAALEFLALVPSAPGAERGSADPPAYNGPPPDRSEPAEAPAAR